MTHSPIAFDTTIAKLGRTGPSVYITNLRHALEALLRDRLHVVSSRWVAPLGAQRTLGDRARTLFRDLWWHQAGVVRAARRAGCVLLHLPADLGPIRGRFPLVLTVHDLAVLRFPQLFRPWHGGYARFVLPRVARRARVVIAVSAATKQDVVELLGVPEERVRVILNGLPPAIGPVPADSARAHGVRARYALPERFVLTVGSVEPRKNLRRLIEAIGLVAERPTGRDVALVHAGPAGWLSRDIPDLVRAHGNGRVRFLGPVATEDLAVLYSLARCCAYPSLWEGFGFPVLEAMASGCPVLTSNVSSLPEVAGDGALLVEPTSTEDIADGLARLWTDDRLREQLIQRGVERAKPFTWERAAAETAAVYDAALS
jgi:glycosyltransferase involved in cell wall biosynthesis